MLCRCRDAVGMKKYSTNRGSIGIVECILSARISKKNICIGIF